MACVTYFCFLCQLQTMDRTCTFHCASTLVQNSKHHQKPNKAIKFVHFNCISIPFFISSSFNSCMYRSFHLIQEEIKIQNQGWLIYSSLAEKTKNSRFPNSFKIHKKKNHSEN